MVFYFPSLFSSTLWLSLPASSYNQLFTEREERLYIYIYIHKKKRENKRKKNLNSIMLWQPLCWHNLITLDKQERYIIRMRVTIFNWWGDWNNWMDFNRSAESNPFCLVLLLAFEPSCFFRVVIHVEQIISNVRVKGPRKFMPLTFHFSFPFWTCSRRLPSNSFPTAKWPQILPGLHRFINRFHLILFEWLDCFNISKFVDPLAWRHIDWNKTEDVVHLSPGSIDSVSSDSKNVTAVKRRDLSTYYRPNGCKAVPCKKRHFFTSLNRFHFKRLDQFDDFKISEIHEPISDIRCQAAPKSGAVQSIPCT